MANAIFPAMRGYVQSDEVLKKHGDGWCISKFDVKVNTGYNKKEQKAEYSWFTIKVWKDVNLSKNDFIIIEGVTPKQERWEKDGKKNSKVVFTANNVYAVGQKTQEQKVKEVFQDDIPF